MSRLIAQLVAVLITAVGGVALLPTSTADAVPPDGCPGGFYVLAVFPGVEFVDENGDGLICGKDLARNPFGGLVLDNFVK